LYVQVLSNATNTGDQTIPFLIELANATNNPCYLATAVRAGIFAAAAVANSYHYVGGACDNPNVLDKEAGVLAMQAFLALHEAR
jgi:hypothetical protein